MIIQSIQNINNHTKQNPYPGAGYSLSFKGEKGDEFVNKISEKKAILSSEIESILKGQKTRTRGFISLSTLEDYLESLSQKIISQAIVINQMRSQAKQDDIQITEEESALAAEEQKLNEEFAVYEERKAVLDELASQLEKRSANIEQEASEAARSKIDEVLKVIYGPKEKALTDRENELNERYAAAEMYKELALRDIQAKLDQEYAGREKAYNEKAAMIEQRVEQINSYEKFVNKMMADDIKKSYNINSEADEYESIGEQILHVSRLINKHNHIFPNPDRETSSSLIDILKNKEGNIPADLLQFLDRVLSIKEESVSLDIIADVISSVRDDKGQFDIEKGALFIGNYTPEQETLYSTINYMNEVFNPIRPEQTDNSNTEPKNIKQPNMSITLQLNAIRERATKNNDDTTLFVLDAKFFKPNAANVRFLDLISQHPEYGTKSHQGSDYRGSREELILHIMNGHGKTEEQFDFCTSMLRKITDDPKLASNTVIKNNLLRFIDIDNELEYKFISKILNMPEVYSNEGFVKHILYDECSSKDRIRTQKELMSKWQMLEYCIELGMLKNDADGDIAGDIVQKTIIPEQKPLWKRYLIDRQKGYKEKVHPKLTKRDIEVMKTTDLRKAIGYAGNAPEFVRIMLGGWSRNYFHWLTPHHMCLAMRAGNETLMNRMRSLLDAINHSGKWAATYYNPL